MDPLRVYVVFDPSFEPHGQAWVTWLSEAFNGLGMQRDECRFGVPVQWRSCPWGEDQMGLPGTKHPRRIALDDAASNCVLLLVSTGMTGFHEARWAEYVECLQSQMARRPGKDLLIAVPLHDGTGRLSALPQAIRDVQPGVPADAAAATRFLVQLLNSLLVHRQPVHQQATHQPGHGIFVSHAKRDGWRTAKRIVETLSRVGQGTRPAFFLDRDSLVPGANYEKRFEQAIEAGSLLALVTDVYHARPWCRWEMWAAKRLGRPIVVAELSTGRIERTFPYLGNVPSLRVPMVPGKEEELSEQTIEQLALALLSEALRFELWLEHARARMAGRDCHLMARPPELADLAAALSQRRQAGVGETLFVYPDPPLGREEVDVLQRTFPDQSVFSLSQAMSRP